MSRALIRIGQRIVKYDDFESAYLATPVPDKGVECELRVKLCDGKIMPAFFGSYRDCNYQMDLVSMIFYNEGDDIPEVDYE